MPLILAIEPNKTQSQQIALLVKQHLKGAELVTAGTADAALTALGTRIPDLILTPALLATRDEAALTERLRELGAAAAHVHTLSLPIIAVAKSRARELGGGLLGRRRDKSDGDPSVGCEPSVFAEQIQVYLDRAAREREASLDAADTGAATQDTPGHAGDDFSEIVWLTDEPVVVLEAPADAAPEQSAAAPDLVVTAAALPVIQGPPVHAEKARPRMDTASTRAYEAEFGLPPSASGAPPLWRVAEVGIEALSAEPEEAIEPPPTVVADHAYTPAVVEPSQPVEPPVPLVVHEPAVARPLVKPAVKAPKTKKHAPASEDWTYFDPQQSAFKALIRRLDEIAGHVH